MSVNPLTADELHHPCDPASLPFETTAELEHIDGVIEQDRARQALQFGLSIKNRNYNIYVAGHSGTGKLSMVRGLLKEIANKDAAPPTGATFTTSSAPRSRSPSSCPRATR